MKIPPGRQENVGYTLPRPRAGSAEADYYVATFVYNLVEPSRLLDTSGTLHHTVIREIEQGGIFEIEFGLYLSAILFGLTEWGIPTIMAAAANDFIGTRLAPADLGFATLFFGVGQAWDLH